MGNRRRQPLVKGEPPLGGRNYMSPDQTLFKGRKREYLAKVGAFREYLRQEAMVRIEVRNK